MQENASSDAPVTAEEPAASLPPYERPVLRRPFVPRWGDIEQGLIPPGHPVAGEEFPTTEAEPEAAKRSGRSLLKDIAETLVLALIIYGAVRAGIQNFKVEGTSMEPSLHNGQYLLVNKLSFASVGLDGIAGIVPGLSSLKGSLLFPFGQPQRGDVVVFRFPRDPARDFIKRVVALPGETVEVKAGTVYVNGKKLDEPYVLDSPTYSKEPTVVPHGEYYVLGDNRNNSSDSHVWGPVPIDEMIGKAWVTYWPMKDWGFIPHKAVNAG